MNEYQLIGSLFALATIVVLVVTFVMIIRRKDK